MIDVLNTPGGMDQLLKLGVYKVPCVVVGERYTFAQNLKDVATFLGIPLEREVLPPDRLVAKYLEILAAAQRMVRQIPVPYEPSISMELFTQAAAWSTLTPFGVITSNGLRHVAGL